MSLEPSQKKMLTGVAIGIAGALLLVLVYCWGWHNGQRGSHSNRPNFPGAYGQNFEQNGQTGFAPGRQRENNFSLPMFGQDTELQKLFSELQTAQKANDTEQVESIQQKIQERLKVLRESDTTTQPEQTQDTTDTPATPTIPTPTQKL